MCLCESVFVLLPMVVCSLMCECVCARAMHVPADWLHLSAAEKSMTTSPLASLAAHEVMLAIA